MTPDDPDQEHVDTETEEPPPAATTGRPPWAYVLVSAAIVAGALIIAGAILLVWLDDGGSEDSTPAGNGTESTAPAAASGATLLEVFLGYAEEVDLDAGEFQACLGSDAPAMLMNGHLQRGIELGVNGTPTFYINNKQLVGNQPTELMEEIIDGELSESPPQSVDEYSAGIQQLAASGRFRIVDAPPDTAGAEFEGNPRAAVVIAEFSDFQCPFCKRWVDQSLATIRERVGDDVALAFLHFPIVQIHPNAGNAGAAAICAGEQGRFWEMHDLLFARQAEWQDIP
jgi:protein-disulfide isomerase